MNLYQFEFGTQPHFVVAESYGDAEETILRRGFETPKRIECLGPYVLISEAVLKDEEVP